MNGPFRADKSPITLNPGLTPWADRTGPKAGDRQCATGGMAVPSPLNDFCPTILASLDHLVVKNFHSTICSVCHCFGVCGKAVSLPIVSKSRPALLAEDGEAVARLDS